MVLPIVAMVVTLVVSVGTLTYTRSGWAKLERMRAEQARYVAEARVLAEVRRIVDKVDG